MMAFGEAWYFEPGKEPIWLFSRETDQRRAQRPNPSALR
jgi:hypothetical protein